MYAQDVQYIIIYTINSYEHPKCPERRGYTWDSWSNIINKEYISEGF